MCFFDQVQFTCGDWEWGHFKQHCNREYRIGKTCGMTLIMHAVQVDDECKVCKKIDTKMKRRAAEVERMRRTEGENQEDQATIAKSSEMLQTLGAEIYQLAQERKERNQRSQVG
jgi:hypothetical protein